MQQILIAGGSPIYQAGLTRLFECYFPDFSVSLASLTNAPSAAEDYALRLFVVGARPLAAEMDFVKRSLRQGRTLLVGGYLSLKLVKRLLAAGAGGYLRQGAAPEHLQQAVSDVLAGTPFIDPELKLIWMNRQLNPKRSRDLDPLTKRERQVLALIIREHTTDEIAEQLFISRCTAETHRGHILQKLGVRNTAGIVREAIRRELCEL